MNTVNRLHLITALMFAAPDARQMAAAPRKGNGQTEPTAPPVEGVTAQAIETSTVDQRDVELLTLRAEVAELKLKLANTDARPFTGLIFSPASITAKVYPYGDQGQSKKIANVLVEIANSGMYLKGNVKQVRENPASPTRAEFSFFAAMPGGSCLVADETNAQATLENYRREVVSSFGIWREGRKTSVQLAPANAVVLNDAAW